MSTGSATAKEMSGLWHLPATVTVTGAFRLRVADRCEAVLGSLAVWRAVVMSLPAMTRAPGTGSPL